MINAEYMNKIENTFSDNQASVVEFSELTYFDAEQYDLYDQKDYGKFIQDIERSVRMSYEYRSLINYLRETEGMNQCTFLTNVTNVDSTKVKIEIHHAPYSLFDIVSAVVKKRLHNNESIDIFDCAKEVMYLHYMGIVGLVPVSETVHELIHNGYIFVPLNVIRGNFRKFIDMYYDYISPDCLDALDNAEEMTKEYLDDISGVNNQVAQQQAIFNIHQTYVRIQNRNSSQSIPPGRDIIKGRITQLKANKKTMYKLVRFNETKEDKENMQVNIIQGGTKHNGY